MEYNIILARFLNWPPTLEYIGFRGSHDPLSLEEDIARLAKLGKVWGGAYVITTHGMRMGKAAYLCHNVLAGAAKALQGPLLWALRPKVAPNLSVAHAALQGLEGLGSFLAAQVVADLKNTEGHPLAEADDWWSFVAHGPGSIRGLQWFWDGANVTAANFNLWFEPLRTYINDNWEEETMGTPICNQDLQNCLCEFDKFMRVSQGTGKSKRNYNGYV